VSGRYDSSAKLVYTTPDGARIPFLAPRILPRGETVASGATTAVESAEVHRLDLVAYRTLRNAELAWRIADANDAMDPLALCARAGTVLRLPASRL
jgi:hypothetical protein